MSEHTIVEFFSEEALENVMCLLAYKPERILFLGHKHTMITRKIESLRAFAALRSPRTELIFKEVPRDNLEEHIRLLDEISDTWPDALYELTGGGEMLFIAFGFLSSRKKLRTIRIDPYTGTEIRMEGDAPQRTSEHFEMTVEENITLHGGTLSRQSGNYSTWRFTPEFMADIRAIWAIATRLGSKWNRYCATIDDVIKACPPDDTGLYILPKSALGESAFLFFSLRDAKVLRDFEEKPSRILFRFKNAMIRHIVTKTGNILELHVYEVASRRPDIFNDQIMGAVINWNNASYDTINEIDVILMRSVVPTFISCKSGHAGSNALHELETITHRFGGNYAKKALVMATACDKSANGTSFFKERAKEMKIWVIDNVYNMSDEALLRKLIRIQGV